MRYIAIENVQPGMILSGQVMDYMDRTLLTEGNALTEEIIERLKKRGYPGIYIEDELSCDIQIPEAISAKLRCFASESLQKLDVDAVLSAAKQIVSQIINSPVITLDLVDLRNFDDYTYRHSVSVAVLSLVTAIGLGYDYDGLIDLSIAALFHDLGKIYVEKSILNKPGKLTMEENGRVKLHSGLSYGLLKDRNNIPERVKAAVLYHHENEDGSGYPIGAKGDSIPPFAKVIHAADVYDALSSKRPYKSPCSFSEALEYLMGGCGTLFDGQVVQTFLNYVPVYPKGITVELSDHREAVVVKNYAGMPLRPKLRLMDGTILNLQNLEENRNVTVLRQAMGHAMVSREIEENEKERNDMLTAS